MISFSNLGHNGRLGNQLFQYSFLRSTAERLGVEFYCPKWIGDEIFCLNDEEQRAMSPSSIRKQYVAPIEHSGHLEEYLQIPDGTDIDGYFQSELNFADPDRVRKWFQWNSEATKRIRCQYSHLDLSQAVGVHVRMGDFIDRLHYQKFYLPSSRYYRKALEEIAPVGPILVFSDEPHKAGQWLKMVLGRFDSKAILMEGNLAWEDLYLMTQCRHLVVGPSTMAWWGGWLNPNFSVFAPQEGPLHPAHRIKNPHFWPPDWKLIPALDYSLRDYIFLARFYAIRARYNFAVYRAQARSSG